MIKSCYEMFYIGIYGCQWNHAMENHVRRGIAVFSLFVERMYLWIKKLFLKMFVVGTGELANKDILIY